MHRSEALDLVNCLDCGAEISLAIDRAYAVSEDAALCFGCAIKRGGLYEEAHDTWSRSPDLSGIQTIE